MVRIACGLLVLLSGVEEDPGIVARMVYEVDQSTRHPGEPQTLAPELFVRLAPDLELGLTHGHAGRGLVDSGAGLCVAGCDGRYRDLGLEARWRFFRGGLIAHDFAPFKPQLLLGVGRAWRSGPFSAAADPYLRLGLAGRDQGNRDFVNLPVAGEVRWRGRVGAYVLTGVSTLLARPADYWSVPAAIGAVADPGLGFEVRMQYGFSHLLGPLNTLADRHLMISVGYRVPVPLGRYRQPRSRSSSLR